MGIQASCQFKHLNSSLQREFENVYKLIKTLYKSLLLEISEVEPASKIDGLRWYKPSDDVLKEWTGSGWKQLYPGVFAE